jgi:hypothetical protein
VRSIPRTITHKRQALVGATIAALALAGLALAQNGFDGSWYTVDGGGARSSGGGYTLEGSIGQPDAGTMSGGGYTLDGGFWAIDSTQTPTVTPTGTLTPSATPTGTLTLSPTSTLTPTSTATATPSPTSTSTATPTPFAIQEAKDNTDKPQKETESERQQRQRTNQGGSDDTHVEGNVVAVHPEARPPYVVIADRDGLVQVNLIGDAASSAGSIQVGDYLQVEGEKQTEALFEASEVTITRNGQRVH